MYKMWDKEEIKITRIKAREGFSARYVGVMLGRSRAAVAFKAMKLGIRFHAIEQPRGVQKRRFRKRK